MTPTTRNTSVAISQFEISVGSVCCSKVDCTALPPRAMLNGKDSSSQGVPIFCRIATHLVEWCVEKVNFLADESTEELQNIFCAVLPNGVQR